MRKRMIQDAAFEVATQVRTVESAIDATLAEIAELQARIMRANSAAATSVATGHKAIEELAAALQNMVSARGSMANCHAALVEAKGKVPGLRTVAFGEPDECPDATGFSNLRIVA